MFYYDVALPLALKSNLTYSSEDKLYPGCRIIVSLRNKLYTAIIWQETTPSDTEIKYLPVKEIIDKKPILPGEILDLAKWVHNYYMVPLGQALFAMLPRALDVIVQVEIKRKILPDQDLKPEYKKLWQHLNEDLWTSVSHLKQKISIPGFYKIMEEMEKADLIEIKRSFDQKIKKKVKNYVVKVNVSSVPELPPKQKELYRLISDSQSDVPLSVIAGSFSYSVVKALKQKKLIQTVPREVFPENSLLPKTRTRSNIVPNEEQKAACAQIATALNEQKFKTFLLYGITGSGKTEVYIRSIKKSLQQGKTALMLVPEISLTPQMVERFYNAFGENIAILHSRLNNRQRWQQWLNIAENRCRIVIGARSAIFAPLKDIGIIIVDEEHENSYKQETVPRYNGRDLAIVRAKMENAVIVLGSATPSLESWHNAITGKYSLLKLMKRPKNIKLPQVQIVDMTLEKDKKSLFSTKLIKLIDEKLKNKQQVILFQNRRGHSSFIQCITCGALFKCPHCDISFNYHSHSEKLVCHYCGKTQNVPRKCPDCGGFLFRFGSPGTQQIEDQLKILYPSARILRMDSDTTSRSDSYNTMFERMKDGSIDILLGTQMISKGLDFPNVTLVGVISADTGLNFPDFRAAESTFQLLTQVAGRSGRGNIHGQVVIQTYNPRHYALSTATNQDFTAFANLELKYREELHYAPYYRIARLLFLAENERFLRLFIDKNSNLFDYLNSAFKPEELYLIGPAPAPLTKINKKTRYHLFLKGYNSKIIHQTANYLLENLKTPAGIKISLDIDPLNML